MDHHCIKDQFLIHPCGLVSSNTICFFFCVGEVCDKPLLKDGRIFPKRVFSGRGGYKYYYLARFDYDGWCASSSRAYLLLDLQKEYHITQVVVMGNKEQTKWSESYVMFYSHDKTYQNSEEVFMLWNL